MSRLGKKIGIGASRGTVVMSATKAVAERLSDYEAEQVRAIADWKAQPPNAIAEAFKMVTLPGARLVEKLIPEDFIRRAIVGAYTVAETLAGKEDVKRRAGVRALAELSDRPLEECDRLARGVSAVSLAFGSVEGSITGVWQVDHDPGHRRRPNQHRRRSRR
jgi:hypothetical protein